MRIAVIGGAGVMGSTAIKDLVDCRLFEEVVIADRNMKKAETVVKDLKDQETEVSARFVDANRHDSLVKAVRDVDIAASTVGPYYKYAVKVMKGAIDAGVNFIDINDDYDATRKALELNDEAKKAGITAIIGMGESPGRTNILAKYGADKMDRVDEIRIAWVAAIGDPSGIGATDHWFHCVTGMIPIYREGKWVDVPARTEPEIVDFGPPIGNAKVFLCGHGEPVTLPRYIKGVNVVNWPLRRLILSYGANIYTRLITGLPVKDSTGGYKCFRRKVLENIDLDKIHSGGYAFQIEMNYKVWKKGFKIAEIPIIFIDRTEGSSKMSKKIVREAIWMVWKLRLQRIFGKI